MEIHRGITQCRGLRHRRAPFPRLSPSPRTRYRGGTGVTHQGCRPVCTSQQCWSAPCQCATATPGVALHGATCRGGAGLHVLLEGFPRRKGGDRFGRDRVGRPGTGIPARPRSAVAELKASKTAQFHRLPRLQGVHNRMQAMGQHGLRLGLREVSSGGHLVERFALVIDISFIWAEGSSSQARPRRVVARGKRTLPARWCQVFCSIGAGARRPRERVAVVPAGRGRGRRGGLAECGARRSTLMEAQELWQPQGKRAEASDLLAPISGWFTEGFDTANLQEAKALLEAIGKER